MRVIFAWLPILSQLSSRGRPAKPPGGTGGPRTVCELCACVPLDSPGQAKRLLHRNPDPASALYYTSRHFRPGVWGQACRQDNNLTPDAGSCGMAHAMRRGTGIAKAR